jgi:RNA binding exosome subunit
MNLPANIPLNFVAMQQMTAEGHSGKIVYVMEVHMKQRCVTEFRQVGKIASNDAC